MQRDIGFHESEKRFRGDSRKELYGLHSFCPERHLTCGVRVTGSLLQSLPLIHPDVHDVRTKSTDRKPEHRREEDDEMLDVNRCPKRGVVFFPPLDVVYEFNPRL